MGIPTTSTNSSSSCVIVYISSCTYLKKKERVSSPSIQANNETKEDGTSAAASASVLLLLLDRDSLSHPVFVRFCLIGPESNYVSWWTNAARRTKSREFEPPSAATHSWSCVCARTEEILDIKRRTSPRCGICIIYMIATKLSQNMQKKTWKVERELLEKNSNLCQTTRLDISKLYLLL